MNWFGRKAVILRAGAAAAICCVLSACSSEGGREWGVLYQMAQQSFGNAPSVSFSQASAIPYATIGVRLGTSGQSLGILGTSSSDEQLWVIGKQIVIVTKGGRIQRTVGLPHNLSWSNLVATPGQSSAQNWSTPRKVMWVADYEDLKLTNVAISCEQRPARIARIRILGKPIDTIRVESECYSSRLNWKFRNVYWTSRASGMVWRSVEHIHPDLDPIQIEVLRPPG